MLPASVGAMVSERKEDMSRMRTSLEFGYPLAAIFAYLTIRVTLGSGRLSWSM